MAKQPVVEFHIFLPLMVLVSKLIAHRNFTRSTTKMNEDKIKDLTNFGVSNVSGMLLVAMVLAGYVRAMRIAEWDALAGYGVMTIISLLIGTFIGSGLVNSWLSSYMAMQKAETSPMTRVVDEEGHLRTSDDVWMTAIVAIAFVSFAGIFNGYNTMKPLLSLFV